MLEKIKVLLDVFGKITLGVLFATAIFITVFWGSDAQIGVAVLWQVLIVSAICSAPTVLFPTDSRKEVSKRAMFFGQLFYFLFVNVVVLGLGNLFGWFSFQNPYMVLLMEILIIAVHCTVSIVCYLNDRATAQNMNEKLQEMKKKRSFEK